MADDLSGQVLALEVALHQRRRVQPDVPCLPRRAFLVERRPVLRPGGSQHLHDRAPARSDQSVLDREPGHARARDPAAGFRDAVRVPHRRSRPCLDVAPQVRRQRRRSAEDALERARGRRSRDPQAHAPDRRHRGQERDAMRIHEFRQPRQHLRPERRHDVEVGPGQPGEEAVADQSVAEVRGQQTEGSTVAFDSETLAQREPARAQRPVRVYHALRITRRPRREEDERGIVQCEACDRPRT